MSVHSSLTKVMADRKVGTKILAVVGVLATVAVLVGGVAVAKLGTLNAQNHDLYESNVGAMELLLDAQGSALRARIDTGDHVLATDAATMDAEEQSLREKAAEVERAMAAYDEADSQNDAVVATFNEAWGEFVTVSQGELFPLSRGNDNGEVRAVNDRLTGLTDTYREQLDLLVESEEQSAADKVAEGDALYSSARTFVIALLVVGLVLAVGLGILVARMIVGALKRVSVSLEAMAEGDLTVDADVQARDEVGQMAESLKRAQAGVREAVLALTTSASTLAASSQELSGVSVQIAASAEEASVQAGVVSAAAEQVSRNVQTVATGSEEMGASIREISQNASEAARVAASAVHEAQATNDTVARLGDSSTEIGNVVKVITSIAEQTNLLALNATIEAARAGEAGKGFAVVANEVKELAQETARATEDISRRVEAIQADTSGAVDAIGRIGSIIRQINDFQVTISSAVEEQTATTNEMARNVAEAATGSGEIAGNITSVAQAAAQTTEGVARSQQAADQLARMSAELEALVGRFTV